MCTIVPRGRPATAPPGAPPPPSWPQALLPRVRPLRRLLTTAFSSVPTESEAQMSATPGGGQAAGVGARPGEIAAGRGTAVLLEPPRPGSGPPAPLGGAAARLLDASGLPVSRNRSPAAARGSQGRVTRFIVATGPGSCPGTRRVLQCEGEAGGQGCGARGRGCGARGDRAVGRGDGAAGRGGARPQEPRVASGMGCTPSRPADDERRVSAPGKGVQVKRAERPGSRGRGAGGGGGFPRNGLRDWLRRSGPLGIRAGLGSRRPSSPARGCTPSLGAALEFNFQESPQQSLPSPSGCVSAVLGTWREFFRGARGEMGGGQQRAPGLPHSHHHYPQRELGTRRVLSRERDPESMLPYDSSSKTGHFSE